MVWSWLSVELRCLALNLSPMSRRCFAKTMLRLVCTNILIKITHKQDKIKAHNCQYKHAYASTYIHTHIDTQSNMKNNMKRNCRSVPLVYSHPSNLCQRNDHGGESQLGPTSLTCKIQPSHDKIGFFEIKVFNNPVWRPLLFTTGYCNSKNCSSNDGPKNEFKKCPSNVPT